MKVFKKYQKKECDTRGTQEDTNMTKDQMDGKRSLTKREDQGEIVITTTDKSGKFCVVETALYKEAALVHIKDEEVINVEQVGEIETTMNRHAMQIVKAMKMGTVHGGENGEEDRIRKAFRSSGGRPGPVQFLIKDHKGIKENEKIPPTRLVCSANGGPTSRLSNLLTIMLNRASDAMEGPHECQSTEELMHGIQKANREIEERCTNDVRFKERMEKTEI